MIDCAALIALQDFDLQLDELTNSIRQRKEKFERVKAELKAEVDLLERKKALFKKIQLRKKKLETDFQELDSRERSVRMKLGSAGLPPAAYSALEKELEHCVQKASECETAILEDMEKLEILENDIEKGDKVTAGKEKFLEEIKQRTTSEIEQVALQRDEVKSRRSQASLAIQSNLLEKYEALRRQKGGRIIWDAETASCPACGMKLPSGFVSAIAAVESADCCPSCSLLIRWTGVRDGIF